MLTPSGRTAGRAAIRTAPECEDRAVSSGEDRTAPPLRFGLEGGSGSWTAERPGGIPASDVPAGVEGTEIRFFPEVGGALPLWDDSGMLDDSHAWLEQHLGLEADLVDRLLTWGRAYDGGPWAGTHEDWHDEGQRLFDAVAARLPEGLSLLDERLAPPE